ncbi:MAG: CpsD/CapB family tyrosine-protein kinase [Clostridia bacterium]|nr:CpsD/CapB family tyrosine-protein kinase [Clostridia bacterium]
MLFKKKNKKSGSSKIIVGGGSNSNAVEAYNRLRDNVLYMNADGKVKVIQIESAVSGEGKTTVACNLAVSLGNIGNKVLVVDLDFHRPHTHRLFKVEKENGIAEYMLGNVEIEQVIKKTEYENVEIITRGAEIYNASVILVSKKFKDLISELRDKYDYIILDCPPVLQVSDFIHISKISDGVLFLSHFASTTKTQVSEAIKELRASGAEILGSVFTMYDKKKDSTADDAGRYHYYYKSYTQDNDKK